MLHWRLALGTLIIAALVALCWLDHNASLPGLWLMPLAVAFVVLATSDLVGLMHAAGLTPRVWIVYAGNILLLLCNWAPVLLGQADNWYSQHIPGNAFLPFIVLVIFMMILFLNEMLHFKEPGRAIIDMASSVFVLVYVGFMFSFLVHLRLAFGIGAMASVVLVVKLGDTGAYFAGRLFGRRQLTPVLSPHKTMEGALGAILFACLGARLSSLCLVGPLNYSNNLPAPWWAWIIYGIILAIAGMLGDLAESLIKRDAGRKDSSTWMPGLGGVLDIIDSLLFAAPAAWLCWVLGLVG